jgi:hypothetical protein
MGCGKVAARAEEDSDVAQCTFGAKFFGEILEHLGAECGGKYKYITVEGIDLYENYNIVVVRGIRH